jgi:hypothetical protein
MVCQFGTEGGPHGRSLACRQRASKLPAGALPCAPPCFFPASLPLTPTHCPLSPTHTQLENMAAMVRGAWSEDPAAQLEATTQFRKLLSIGALRVFFPAPAGHATTRLCGPPGPSKRADGQGEGLSMGPGASVPGFGGRLSFVFGGALARVFLHATLRLTPRPQQHTPAQSVTRPSRRSSPRASSPASSSSCSGPTTRPSSSRRPGP